MYDDDYNYSKKSSFMLRKSSRENKNIDTID